jgi:exopolyphosphatase / guanosine-5'-triphosphate,3'-diphosphate pyrophosphatase
LPRFAAIDVGSNASRLRIVSVKEVEAKRGEKVDPERPYPGWKTLVSERVPVRLGHSVFQTGALDPAMMDLEVETMRHFAGLMEDHEVDAYRAVVTASTRGASNGQELIQRVHKEAGIRLESIDGIEEARLVALAVSTKIDLEGHSLIMDLGGGSLELSELDNQTPRFSTSLPIGTVRFLEAFMSAEGPVDAREDALVREALDRILSPIRDSFSGEPFARLVGTGGNLEAIAKLCGERRGSNDLFTRKAAVGALQKLAKLTSGARAKRFDLKPDRADVIVPALYVVTAVAKLVGAEVIDVPRVGLREGLLREQVERHFEVWDERRERRTLVASARAYGRRFHFDERHAEKVVQFAMRLFEALSTLHRLGESESKALELAAWLHDIGDFVSPSSHHKHSQYLIEHGEIMGLSQGARRFVALLVRFHRGSPPSVKNGEIRAMDAEERRRFAWLVGMLRVADALDREHRSKVKAIRVRIEGDAIAIDVEAEDDVSLELWTVGRKASVLEEASGKRVVVSTT